MASPPPQDPSQGPPQNSGPPQGQPQGPPQGGPQGGGGPQIRIGAGPGGVQPTPEQIQQVQRRIAEDAQKAGMTVPEFLEHIKKQAMEKRAAQQQQGGQPGAPQGAPQQHPPQQGGRPGQVKQAITPGPPKPQALAIAKFLRGQDLKTRTCILNGERKDMFRGRRSQAVARKRAC